MRQKILLVDDHEDFRKAVKEYLEKNKLNLEIFEASTAEMAVTKAACIKPDIVLMDMSLPGENGFQASQQIKDDNPDCDIIILTMFDLRFFREMAKEFPTKDFVAKNEVYERLIPAINRCLKDRERKN